MYSATVKEKKKNLYWDFSSSNQNIVQLDPTEKNDASESKKAIWKDISSWVTEVVYICRREESLRRQHLGSKCLYSSQEYIFIS